MLVADYLDWRLYLDWWSSISDRSGRLISSEVWCIFTCYFEPIKNYVRPTCESNLTALWLIFAELLSWGLSLDIYCIYTLLWGLAGPENSYLLKYDRFSVATLQMLGSFHLTADCGHATRFFCHPSSCFGQNYQTPVVVCTLLQIQAYDHVECVLCGSLRPY